MIDPDSRYADLDVLVHTTRDGRTVQYVARRFLPDPEGMRALGQVRVADGDRLDSITARSFGDPGAFWRICDANEAMHPPDLLRDPGRMLKLPSPI